MSRIFKIFKHNENLVVSSRTIAEELGKQHKNIIRDLENIFKEEIGSDLSTSIFESEYKDKMNRTQKEYLLTRDGFTLYMFNIQGYNDFKMEYIQEFNRMQEFIDVKGLTEAYNRFRTQEAHEHHVNHQVMDTEQKCKIVDRFIAALVNMINDTKLNLLKEDLLELKDNKITEDYQRIRKEAYTTAERFLSKGKILKEALKAVAGLYGYELEEIDSYKKNEEINQATLEFLENKYKPAFGDVGYEDWKEVYSFLF